MASVSPAAVALKALRERAGMTVQEVADAIGRPKSTYASYEDKYKKPFLPIDLVRDLEKVFAPRGISGQELFTLAGVERGGGQANGGSAERPRTSRQMAETLMVQELDVRASAGAGAADPSEIDAEGRVIGEWSIPAPWVRQVTAGPTPTLKVISIMGDSMEPEFRPNSRVFVDLADNVPTPPGYFAVWDGLGLVIKRVEHIPFSQPSTVQISSLNPAYKPYERTLEEAHIWGRVVGHLRST